MVVRHLPDCSNKLYVICIYNYFTLVKTMIATRKRGVACMGTARAQKRWPFPEFIKEAKDAW